jgi:hypothetical protein
MIEGSMGFHDKFSGPSRFIDISRLERQSRHFLYLGFVFAILFHGLLGIFITFKAPLQRVKPLSEKLEKPIKVDFIIVPPRSLEQFKVSERQFKKKDIKRESVDILLPSKGIGFKSVPFWGEPNISDFRPLESEQVPQLEMNPQNESFINISPSYDTRISRKPEHQFSLEEEGLTIADIDSLGEYKGFIIQNSMNKKKVNGFIYIPESIVEIPLKNPNSGRILYKLDCALKGLLEVVNLFTGIIMKTDPKISFNSSDLFRYPIIFLTSASDYSFELSSLQTQRLCEYLRKGGFAIIDNGSPWKEYSPAEASFLNILLKTSGKDMGLEPIPADHPIYHCFFEMNGKLPEGAENQAEPIKEEQVYNPSYQLPSNPWGEHLLHVPELENMRKKITETPDCLWGVWFEGRLVAVYSDKGYGHLWKDGYYYFQHRNNLPVLQLGVNLVMFALTQPGSIAKQSIDYSDEGKAFQIANKKKE